MKHSVVLLLAMVGLAWNFAAPVVAGDARPFQQPPWAGGEPPGASVAANAPGVGRPAPRGNGFHQLPLPDQTRVMTFFLLIGSAIGLGVLALLLMYSVVRPQALRDGSMILAQHPVRSLLAGLLTALVLVLAVMLVQNLPEALRGLFALLVILVTVYVCVSGVAVAAHELGDRVLSNINSASVGVTFLAVLWGGLLLLLAGFVPFLGQLVQVVAGAMGLGAAVSLMLRRKAPAASADAAPDSKKEEDTAIIPPQAAPSAGEPSTGAKAL